MDGAEKIQFKFEKLITFVQRKYNAMKKLKKRLKKRVDKPSVEYFTHLQCNGSFCGLKGQKT